MACKVMCVQGASAFSLFLGCMLPAHCWESRWVGEVTQEHTTHFITMFCSRETLRIKRLSTWWNRYIHKQSKDRLPWATSMKNETYLPWPCPHCRQWVHGFHSKQLSPLLILPALLQGGEGPGFWFSWKKSLPEHSQDSWALQRLFDCSSSSSISSQWECYCTVCSLHLTKGV